MCNIVCKYTHVLVYFPNLLNAKGADYRGVCCVEEHRVVYLDNKYLAVAYCFMVCGFHKEDCFQDVNLDKKRKRPLLLLQKYQKNSWLETTEMQSLYQIKGRFYRVGYRHTLKIIKLVYTNFVNAHMKVDIFKILFPIYGLDAVLIHMSSPIEAKSMWVAGLGPKAVVLLLMLERK